MILKSDIKNCASYYFGEITKDVGIIFSDTLLGEKWYEHISVYDISRKISTGPKPLSLRLDRIDEFIRVCGGVCIYLVLSNHGLFDQICDKIKHLMGEKRCITDSINHNFGKIRND